ncbi:MAG TPA: ABC transporter permease [Bryobacteraceae bacterium]|nr:ABC transporter permease [Bryobacteraceae bacterium]
MIAPFRGLVPVCRKELTHMARDRGTLFFAAFIPILQLVLFGFAIDTNIRQVPTIVLDESRTQESRRLLDRFANSDVFALRYAASSEADVYRTIRAGKARAAIRIPPDYTRRPDILVLVDGSDSTITSSVVNVARGLMVRDFGPGEARVAVLYNPATRSPNFFVPGMIAIVLQAMIIVLVALSIVRERERGTLEQLTMTPVAPLGLMVGKMIPYGVLGFLELCTILTIMRIVFQVPIHGNVALLLAMSLPFLLTLLGIGLLISTKARTQAEAFQLAVGTLLPSVFLSGYIFLIENMPYLFQFISRIIPATYYIRILRGIILRGASFGDLWVNGLALTVMGCAATVLAARQFVQKRA